MHYIFDCYLLEWMWMYRICLSWHNLKLQSNRTDTSTSDIKDANRSNKTSIEKKCNVITEFLCGRKCSLSFSNSSYKFSWITHNLQSNITNAESTKRHPFQFIRYNKDIYGVYEKHRLLHFYHVPIILI